jgi:hypothetical protein
MSTVYSTDPVISEAIRQFASRRAGDLKHPPNWIRQDAGPLDEVIAVARSYLANPVNYMLITPDGVVRDGNRRLVGILADTGPETQVPVCITTEEITPVASLEIMLETAEHTKALTPYEQYLGYSQWIELTGSSATALAKKINLSDSAVSRTLSLAKGKPEVIEAARAGLIDSMKWSKIVGSLDQLETLRLITSGEVKGRSQLAAAVKRMRQPSADTVKLGTLVIHQQDSRRVILKGPVNLSTAEQMLSSALKDVQKAQQSGLSARSAQSMWKDTSKKPKKPRQPKETT